MPGFLVSNKKSHISLRDAYPDRCLHGELFSSESNNTAIRQTLNKFMMDKAFEETESLAVIVEGYLLNKKALFETYKASSVTQLVEKMLGSCGECFFRDFRGCFSGAVYQKTEQKWIVFTNHIGDNPVFYSYVDGIFAAGSQVQYVLDFCYEQGISLSFNEDCAYQMLTYGFMAGNDTYANEIKRLHGGDYLIVSSEGIEVKTYHRFEAHPERLSGKTETDIIDLIDNAFRQAVKMEWEKDDEYDYKHLADLSGGLDSRMNLWVAHEMKDRHLTVLTYSKEGELDESISKAIAAYWNDELLFKPLDDISFMRDIDENTALLGGLSLYSGITGGKRLLECLNLSGYGVEHTGMVGDAALGSFYHNDEELFGKTPTGRYSEKLSDRLPERLRKLSENYNNYEIYLMYVRGFHGACNSHLIRRNFTEVGSPFLNVEFLQLCYDIPVELRMGHHIYKRWVSSKYPRAAQFKWEKLGGKITESPVRSKIRRLAKRGPKKVLKLFGYHPKDNHGMNPIDYWIANNTAVRECLDEYERKAIVSCKQFLSEPLITDIEWLYHTGNAWEKSMSLTVLASAKLYFGVLVNGENPEKN